MQAKFYNCTRDERYVYKLKESDQTNTESVSVEMLTPANNVTHPQIRLQSGRIGRSTNYVWLEDLKRFYYIRSWNMENGYITCDLEVDVLMTYRTELASSNVMIKRVENYMVKNSQGQWVWKFPRSAKPNYYLPDSEMKFNAYTNVRVKNFPSGFNKTAQSFFLAIAGDVNNSNE